MGFFNKVFSETVTNEGSSKDFSVSVEKRRSIYAISDELVVSDKRITEVINHAVKHTPSAFNSQTARAVVLLGGSHRKLWNITTETLRKVVPADQFTPTQEKMNAFSGGYGTVLFFEDMSIVENLQAQFPSYADNFPVWSLQSSGMVQFVIWTSLENEGFGASLQHYNPLIDDDVKKEFNIPAGWKLLAQMPFGKPTGVASEKEISPIENRVIVHK